VLRQEAIDVHLAFTQHKVLEKYPTCICYFPLWREVPRIFPIVDFFALRKLAFFFAFSPMHACVPSLRLITRVV